MIHLVRRFANEIIKPRVRQMDEDESMHPDVIKGLFDNGVDGERSGSILNILVDGDRGVPGA